MKPHQRITAVIVLGFSMCFGAGTSLGAAQEIQAVDTGLFQSSDLNDDGRISRRESLHYNDLVFLSMDADGDDVLTVEEFLLWDPGYISIAEANERGSQVNSAKREIFESRDLNGDGNLDHDEFSASSLYDYYLADLNQDRVLSQDEFVGEYRMLNAIRSALE